MSERVHLRELATRLGHNPGYIHHLKAKGILVFGDDGLIGEKEALAAIEAARERLLAPSTSSRYMAARASRAFYSAQLSELDLMERVALLIDAKAARDAQLEITLRVRDRLLIIPGRLAAQIAAESDQARVRDILSREIKRALSTALADPEEAAE